MLRFAISFSPSNLYSETLHDNLLVARAKRSIDEENQSTVRENMATDTFTYKALRSKTIKERIKPQRKIVIHSNSTRAMLLV